MDNLIGRELAGCRLTKLLGKGAIGAVYEATHTSSQQVMAVKVLSPEAKSLPGMVERFEREARLCYQLDHPNVVKVFTWGTTDDGIAYMAMEHVRGATLAQMIKALGQLPWPIACAIVSDIAVALRHVHELDIVHRDIKPGNILVARDGKGVLADLGLARQTVGGLDENAGGRLTVPGQAIGSPAYMAPEQIIDTSSVGPMADIYALGATVYAAILGQPPLAADTPNETVRLVMTQTAHPLHLLIPEVPVGISNLIAQCLAKEPPDRPASAAEFARQLDDVLRAEGHALGDAREAVRQAEV